MKCLFFKKKKFGFSIWNWIYRFWFFPNHQWHLLPSNDSGSKWMNVNPCEFVSCFFCGIVVVVVVVAEFVFVFCILYLLSWPRPVLSLKKIKNKNKIFDSKYPWLNWNQYLVNCWKNNKRTKTKRTKNVKQK